MADGLPLAFVLIVMTVWVGLRLHTTFVVAHDLAFGAVAILFTLQGNGPFAQIDSHAMRALIAQLFVGTIAVVGLALALGRDERSALIAELRDSHRAATTNARRPSPRSRRGIIRRPPATRPGRPRRAPAPRGRTTAG